MLRVKINIILITVPAKLRCNVRDLITTIHFFMNEGWLPHFKMQAIKVDKSHIETYSDTELQALLKKPNVKKCSFTEYQSWVMTNFLFATGVRPHLVFKYHRQVTLSHCLRASQVIAKINIIKIFINISLEK